MSRLTFKIFAWLAPLVLTLAFFERGLARVETSFSMKAALFASAATRAETLVLGNSQTMGVDPSLSGRPGFNLANFSQSLYHDRAILEKYAPQMPRLKTVVVTLSHFSMEYNSADGPEYSRNFLMERAYGLAPESAPGTRLWSDVSRFSLFFLYGPVESVSRAFAGFRSATPQPFTSSGVYDAPSDPKPDALSEAAAGARVKLHRSLMKETHRGPNREHLAAIVKIARAAGAEPVVMSPPVHRAYRERIGILPVDKETLTWMKRSGVPYWDLSADPSFTDADFENPDHLNRAGRRKLSLHLDRRIASIG